MGVKEIFKQGMQEMKRRSALGKVKRDFKNREKLLSDRLTALGQKAWESRVDIHSYSELKSSITDTQNQIDEFKTRKTDLEKQQQEIDNKKQQENSSFDARRKEVEEKKKHVDSRLDEERKAMKSAQKEADSAKNRLKQIEKEKDQLGQKAAEPTTSDLERDQIRQKLAGFDSEKPQLERQLQTSEETVQRQLRAMAPIETESTQLQKEIDHIKSEQKKVISTLDQQLSTIKKALNECTNNLDKVVNQQNGHFKHLGEKLAETEISDTAVAPEMSEIRNIKKEMGDTRSQMEKLENQGTVSSQSAFWKMIGLIVGFIVAIILIIILINALFGSKKTPADAIREGIIPDLPRGTMTLPQSNAVQKAVAQQIKKNTGIQPPPFINASHFTVEKPPTGSIIVANQETLTAALPPIGSWQMQEPRFFKHSSNQLEYSQINTTYSGPDNKSIEVEITDTGTASAMLQSFQLILTQNLTMETPDHYQKIITQNDITFIERVDKHSQDANVFFIIKNRYLIKLQATGENSLALLKYFVAKFDPAKL